MIQIAYFYFSVAY